jgi:hypothetical protein
MQLGRKEQVKKTFAWLLWNTKKEERRVDDVPDVIVLEKDSFVRCAASLLFSRRDTLHGSIVYSWCRSWLVLP